MALDLSTARDRLGEAIFLRVAGPDGSRHRARIHGTPGPRWFQPGSPICRVHGDASMFVGGLRALMMQSLHPVAMTAVAEHSGFRGDLWGRLARTSRFVAVTTFGAAGDAERAVAQVRRVHDRVSGSMPDGTPYAATDPHLLLWVHIAEVDSFLRAHDRHGRAPLSAADRDEYVAQAGEVAVRLGVVDPPRTVAGLAARLAAYRPELGGTAHAREAVDLLLRHPPLPVAARPGYAVLAHAAVAEMPDWSRPMLGLPDRPLVDRVIGPVAGEAATRTIRWAMQAGGRQAAAYAARREQPA